MSGWTRNNFNPGRIGKTKSATRSLKSDVVIVCLSRGFNKQQGYRHEELKLALEKAKFLPDDEVFIIPVRLERCAMPEVVAPLTARGFI